jgi:hypothetical protein
MPEKTNMQQLDEFFEDWIKRMERLRREARDEDTRHQWKPEEQSQ